MLDSIALILIKFLIIALLIVYFILSLLGFRQGQLMSRAVKTLISGFLNFLSLLNLLFIFLAIVLILIV